MGPEYLCPSSYFSILRAMWIEETSEILRDHSSESTLQQLFWAWTHISNIWETFIKCLLFFISFLQKSYCLLYWNFFSKIKISLRNHKNTLKNIQGSSPSSAYPPQHLQAYAAGFLYKCMKRVTSLSLSLTLHMHILLLEK